VDILLRAVAQLHATNLSCRLRILGEGPSEAGLRDLAGRLGLADVEWSPFVPQDRMPAEYGASTITVLPSRGRFEGLGLTLVEALLAGSSVVGSAVGGIPEVVEDRVTGVLVRDGDADELARALRELLQDRALRDRLSDAGRARVAKIYGADTAADAYLDLYARAGHG
jgi:glycosyltransferase involved in cell wall biosynthesis